MAKSKRALFEGLSTLEMGEMEGGKGEFASVNTATGAKGEMEVALAMC